MSTEMKITDVALMQEVNSESNIICENNGGWNRLNVDLIKQFIQNGVNILHKTITGTLSDWGNLTLGINAEDYIVISCYCSTSNYLTFLYVSSNNTWGCTVRQNSFSKSGGASAGVDLAPKFDTELTLEVYYVSKTQLISLASGSGDSRSEVGDVITSSTLDTMEKVIARYGGIRWEKIEGRFILGASDDHPVGETGGEETHILTPEEMPGHQHEQYVTHGNDGGPAVRNDFVSDGTGMVYSQGVNTGWSGRDKPHNNMPPYKAYYMWERTE